MNKKLIIYSLIVAALGVMVAGPALAMATSTGTTTPKNTANFCTRFSSLSANADLRLAEWQKKLDAKRDEQAANIEERRVEREQKLANIRSDWDSRRDARYDKLMGKAATDEQKQALANFKAAVETAVAARKAAIDAAISVYRAGMDKVIADRKAGMDAALVAYKNAVQAAKDKAAADCGASVAPATVRASFTSAVQAAKDKFKADRAAVVKVSDAVKALNTARKAAFDKAVADFKAVVEAAKVTLKDAFPVKDNATSTPKMKKNNN